MSLTELDLAPVDEREIGQHRRAARGANHGGRNSIAGSGVCRSRCEVPDR